MDSPNFGFPAVIWKESDDFVTHGRKELKKQYQEDRNPVFWSRIGGKPQFEGSKVLEVGCGFGALSIDIGLSGAQKVVGLDIDERDIEFANLNLAENYPQLQNTVEYKSVNISDYQEKDFDYIISKDTFEHVNNLPELLSQIKIHLKDGGYLYSGFGPLWNSPFGFHGDCDGWNFQSKYPWGHLLVKRSTIVDSFNKSQSKVIEGLQGIGLNGMSLADYQDAFMDSGLEIVKCQVNHTNNYKSRLFSTLGQIPGLKEYFSHHLYVILKKKIR